MNHGERQLMAEQGEDGFSQIESLTREISEALNAERYASEMPTADTRTVIIDKAFGVVLNQVFDGAKLHSKYLYKNHPRGVMEFFLKMGEFAKRYFYDKGDEEGKMLDRMQQFAARVTEAAVALAEDGQMSDEEKKLFLVVMDFVHSNALALFSSDFGKAFPRERVRDVMKGFFKFIQDLFISDSEKYGVYFKFVVLYGSDEDKKRLSELLRRLNEKKELSFLSTLLAQKGEVGAFALEFLKEYLADYDLDGEKFFQAWCDACPIKSRQNFIYRNLGNITELETNCPGSARSLHDDFGIYCFGRYPYDLLLKQYKEKDRVGVPCGLHVCATSDHNGAFLTVEPKINLVEFSEQIAPGCLLRVVECGSKWQLGRRLLRVYKKYGQINFVVLTAHGDRDGVELGSKNIGDQPSQSVGPVANGAERGTRHRLAKSDFWTERKTPKTDTLEKFKHVVGGFKGLFRKNFTAVFDSCLVGSVDGFAEAAQGRLGMGKVLASEKKVYGVKLDGRKRDSEGMPVITASFPERK